MVAHGSSSQSGLRQAVELLLRTRAEAEQLVAEAGCIADQQAARVAEIARQGRHPAARLAADRVAEVGGTMSDPFDAVSAEATAAIAAEVHSLLDLLAVNQLDTLPPLDPGPLSVPGGPFAEAFPEGFARDYVRTVLRDLPRGAHTEKDEAAAQPDASQAVIDASRQRILGAVSPEHRAQVKEWLEHPDCHAVEIHGPHVSDKALELRVGWTRPPDHGTDGADRWRIREDEKVISKHRVMVDASTFTNAQAFARPLEVFLEIASLHPQGVDGFLADHSASGVAPFFIAATMARLGSGDAISYRGAGTDTREAARDWMKMRSDAMKKAGECGPPVRTIPYDPIAEGTDPGVRLVFKDSDDGWVMVTYYPSAHPAQDNKRLEELT